MNIWFLSSIILIVLEILTVNLISIWFAIGCFLSGICSLFIDDLIVEMIIFLFVSAISLVLTKPIIKKLKKNDSEKLNLDRIIGKNGFVTEEIDKFKNGEVKIDGKCWTAVSDSKIEKGVMVKILKIEGVKLKVEKIKEEE